MARRARGPRRAGPRALRRRAGRLAAGARRRRAPRRSTRCSRSPCAAPTRPPSSGRARCGCATRSRPATSATADEELGRLERLAAESRRSYYRWCLLVLQAAVALFAGRLDEGERLAEEAVELNRRHGDDADQEHTVQRLALALERRDPHDVPLAALRDYAARYPRLPVWQAMLARAEHALGHADAARAARRRAAPATASPSSCARPTGCAGSCCSPSRSPRTARRTRPSSARGGARPAAERQRDHGRGLGRVRPASRAPLGVARRRGRPAGRGRRATSRAAVALPPRWGAPAWELAALADWAASRRAAAPARDAALGRARCASCACRTSPIRRRRRRTPRRRRVEVVLGGGHVAVRAPATRPTSSGQEAGGRVADERGRVHEARRLRVEARRAGRSPSSNAWSTRNDDEHRALLGDPRPPVGEPVRGLLAVRVEPVVGGDPVARGDVVEVLDAAGVERAVERQVLLVARRRNGARRRARS